VNGYLVLGPESSGTNLTSAVLRAGGCRLLDEDPPDGRPPLLRVSLPYALEWPALSELVSRLKVHEPRAVVTTRDVFAMAGSQVAAGHVTDLAMAFHNIRRAYVYAFQGLGALQIPFVVSSYESLATRAAYPERLLSALGLRPARVAVYDGNQKWYESGDGDRTVASVRGLA
jgi:hypothetical protein